MILITPERIFTDQIRTNEHHHDHNEHLNERHQGKPFEGVDYKDLHHHEHLHELHLGKSFEH